MAAPLAAPAPPPAPPAPPPAPPAPPARATPPARAAPPAPPPAPAGGRAAGPELPLGTVFAGCRVEEVISHGDMGVVYRAEELALQREVALKLILPEYSRDERFRERFRRESRIAAAIDHPNVIPIFDAGDESGVLYIMMRLVEGTDLRAVIAAEGPIEPLADGAHRPPGRLPRSTPRTHAGCSIATSSPRTSCSLDEDHVYLSDFGLAKRRPQPGTLTRGQTIVARAEYVAPEQILNERIDARADIYALGCLLFEALTGEAPFARWTGGPGALAHLDAPRPSPSDMRPDLPRGVRRRGAPRDGEGSQRALPVGRRPRSGRARRGRRAAAGASLVGRRHRRGGPGRRAGLGSARIRDGRRSRAGPPCRRRLGRVATPSFAWRSRSSAS